MSPFLQKSIENIYIYLGGNYFELTFNNSNNNNSKKKSEKNR